MFNWISLSDVRKTGEISQLWFDTGNRLIVSNRWSVICLYGAAARRPTGFPWLDWWCLTSVLFRTFTDTVRIIRQGAWMELQWWRGICSQDRPRSRSVVGGWHFSDEKIGDTPQLTIVSYDPWFLRPLVCCGGAVWLEARRQINTDLK